MSKQYFYQAKEDKLLNLQDQIDTLKLDLSSCSHEDYDQIIADIESLESEIDSQEELTYEDARADYLYDEWKENRHG